MLPIGSRGASKRERLQEQLVSKVRLLSSAGQPAGAPEADSLRAAPYHEGRAHCPAPCVHFVRRTLRRVWFAARFGDHVLVAGQHLGCPGVRRHGGGGGNGSVGSDSHRAGIPRFRVLGHCVFADSYGGPAAPAVCAQAPIPESPLEGLWRAHSPTLGNHDVSLYKRNRCHPGPADRGHQLFKGKAVCSGGRPTFCKTSAPSVSQQAQGCSSLSGLPFPDARRFSAPPVAGSFEFCQEPLCDVPPGRGAPFHCCRRLCCLVFEFVCWCFRWAFFGLVPARHRRYSACSSLCPCL